MTKIIFGGISFGGNASVFCQRMAKTAVRWNRYSFDIRQHENAWLGQLRYQLPLHTSSNEEMNMNSLWETESSCDNGLGTIASIDFDRQTIELTSGITPVFYATTKNALLFASDPTIVCSGSEVAPTLCHESVISLLLSDHLGPNQTLFKEVTQLPPIHAAIGQRGDWSSPESNTRSSS
ncbi:MAG: hypothetical protein P1U77_28640, partial [Rubripirellula sp.]|nr:hypothetical protein [Rubripirellula sp.]